MNLARRGFQASDIMTGYQSPSRRSGGKEAGFFQGVLSRIAEDLPTVATLPSRKRFSSVLSL